MSSHTLFTGDASVSLKYDTLRVEDSRAKPTERNARTDVIAANSISINTTHGFQLSRRMVQRGRLLASDVFGSQSDGPMKINL